MISAIALIVAIPLVVTAPAASAQSSSKRGKGKRNAPPQPIENIPSLPIDPPGLSRKPVEVPSDEPTFGELPAGPGFARGRKRSMKPFKEVPGLRGQRIRFFADDNGAVHYAQLYAGPANYQDVSGQWRKIDNSIVAEPGGFRNAGNSFTAHFPQRYQLGDPVTVELEQGSFDLSLLGAQPSLADPRAEAVVYREVLTDTDLKYQVHASGFKEELILRSADAPASF